MTHHLNVTRLSSTKQPPPAPRKSPKFREAAVARATFRGLD
ncbi:MAG: hypothetical protein ABJL67_22520 [Sulfitobacter sp.]